MTEANNKNWRRLGVKPWDVSDIGFHNARTARKARREGSIAGQECLSWLYLLSKRELIEMLAAVTEVASKHPPEEELAEVVAEIARSEYVPGR